MWHRRCHRPAEEEHNRDGTECGEGCGSHPDFHWLSLFKDMTQRDPVSSEHSFLPTRPCTPHPKMLRSALITQRSIERPPEHHAICISATSPLAEQIDNKKAFFASV